MRLVITKISLITIRAKHLTVSLPSKTLADIFQYFYFLKGIRKRIRIINYILKALEILRLEYTQPSSTPHLNNFQPVT